MLALTLQQESGVIYAGFDCIQLKKMKTEFFNMRIFSY